MRYKVVKKVLQTLTALLILAPVIICIVRYGV